MSNIKKKKNIEIVTIEIVIFLFIYHNCFLNKNNENKKLKGNSQKSKESEVSENF